MAKRPNQSGRASSGGRRPKASAPAPTAPEGRFTLGQVRRAFRLIGRVRSLGADPARWRSHMVTRLKSLLAADMVVSSELSFRVAPGKAGESAPASRASPKRPTAILRDCGWGIGADGRHWEIDDEHVEPRPQDYHVLLASSIAPDGTAAGASVSPDGRIAVRPRRRLRAGRYFLLSQWELPHVDTVDQLGVYRFDISRPFTRADARLLRLFHTELGRLWRADAMQKARDPEADLPPRLSQTVGLLVAGLGEKQVARELGISQHTVHNYVKALHKRFGVNTRGELLARVNPPPGERGEQGFRPRLTAELPHIRHRAGP